MGGGGRWLGLCLLLALAGPGRALQNVTAQLFGAEAYGTLAAFGDFNSDKQTDLFVLRGGNELIIFLADQKEPYFKPRVKLPMKSLSVTITSVVPGDYDGDSQMDVLLTTRAQNHGRDELSVFIFWGHNQTLDLNHKTMLNKTFRDEPLVMDFNGDLIPDVFGVTNDSSKPQILIGGNFSWHAALETQSKMYIPHSHAFVDLNNDFTADLFLTTSPNSQSVQFEMWVNKDGNFSRAEETKEVPSGMKVVGQSVFADFGKQSWALENSALTWQTHCSKQKTAFDQITSTVKDGSVHHKVLVKGIGGTVSFRYGICDILFAVAGAKMGMDKVNIYYQSVKIKNVKEVPST